MFYILTGLFAGIVIGFGTALIIQKNPLPINISGIHSGDDTLSGQLGNNTDRFTAYERAHQHITSENQPSTEENILADSSYIAGTIEDTITAYNKPGEEVVLRDELLLTKRIKATGALAPDAEQRGSDSLLHILTSAKPTGGKPTEYQIEFWQNPVNYKGYKMGKERIIIFGLPPDQSYKLYYMDGLLYLQNKSHTYPLRETSDFLPLIPSK